LAKYLNYKVSMIPSSYHMKEKEKEGWPCPLQWAVSLSKCLTFHGGQILLITWPPDTLDICM